MTLEQRMRHALAQLVVISTAPTQNYDGRTSRGKPSTLSPPSSEDLTVSLERQWNHAHTDGQRQAAVDEAETLLLEWRYAKQPPVDCTTVEGKLKVGLDTRTAEAVARAYNCSTRHVYRMRAEARRLQAFFPSGVPVD